MPVRIALLLAVMLGCAAPSVVATKPAETAAKAGPQARPPAPPSEAPAPETLAQCLARKGMRLYGASWCGPCHQQLDLFGAQAKDVPYTDCQPEGTFTNIPECDALDVQNYPTWIFSDGFRVIGVRSLEWLSASTDCPLR